MLCHEVCDVNRKLRDSLSWLAASEYTATRTYCTHYHNVQYVDSWATTKPRPDTLFLPVGSWLTYNNIVSKLPWIL